MSELAHIADESDTNHEHQVQRDLANARLSEIEAIYSYAPIGLCSFDTNLRWIRINQCLADMNGFPIESHLGRNVRELLPDLADQFEPLLQQIVATGKPVLDLEISGETAAQPGVIRQWIVSWLPMHDQHGVVNGITVVAEEVTVRKAIEIERQDYQRSIEEARVAADQARTSADASNRAKSEFLANMSHEIRTPLSAILGFSEILSGTLEDPDDLQAVDTIRLNVDHLQSLLTDFLDLAKIEAGQLKVQREPVDIRGIVEEIDSMMRVRAVDAGLQLSVEYSNGIPHSIMTDPVRLRQILINLLSNAIKFTEYGQRSGGDVRLIIRLEDQPNRHVIFDIIDYGIGLTKGQQKALFQPFSQVDESDTRRYEGTGLGLAISRRLVDLLGGEISVVSERGKGSTFSVKLAYDLDESIPLAAVKVSNKSIAAKDFLVQFDARLLVIDDRTDIRMLMHFHLEKAGAHVESYSSGESALASIHNGVDKLYDLVLVDIQMPGISGYETARSLRAKGFTKPILALTAAALSGERKRCIDAGCSDYLPKPINQKTLLKKIAAHLDASLVSYKHKLPTRKREKVQGAADDTPETMLSYKIMVIEDHDVLRSVMVRLLQRSGHQMLEASSAEEARTVLLTHIPDLIFIDIGLPGRSGLEFAHELRSDSKLSNIRLISLSGNTEGMSDTHTGPFDFHLLKPVDNVTMLATIASVCGPS